MRRRDLNCVGISWKVKKVARKAVFLTEYFELFVGLIGYANAKKMSKKKDVLIRGRKSTKKNHENLSIFELLRIL